MPEINFISPGAEAGDALQRFLLRQEASRRQRMLDTITQQREGRLAQKDAADLELAKQNAASLAEQRAAVADQRKSQAADAETKRFTSAHLPGDTLTPEVAAAHPDLTTVESVGSSPAANTELDRPIPGMLQVTQQGKYVGDAAQRQKKQQTDAITGYLAQNPDVAKRPDVQLAVQSGDPDLLKNVITNLGKSDQPKYHEVGGYLFQEQPDGTLKKVAEGRAPQGPQPTYATVILPDGTIAQRNTHDPNAPLIPVMGPDGTPAKHVTAQTQGMMEGASMLQPHIDSTRKLAESLDQKGLFGPAMSRVRDIASHVGSIDEFANAVMSDPQLNADRSVGQFSTMLGLLATGAGRVHGGARGGGSPQMFEHFKHMLSDASSLPMFEGRLDALDEFMGGYAAGPGGEGKPATPAPGGGNGKGGGTNPDAEARKAALRKKYGL